jgi:aspartyl-tRNA(Asn)/glutamyl-tRNA(Gln) amidotransferase subunit A
MDPVVAARLERGLAIPADQYIAAVARHRELIVTAERLMDGLDGWVTPAAALVPPPVADFDDLEKALKIAFSITKSSQPINLFGQCGVSLPIHHLGSDLPVGLQIACSPGSEAKLLSIALAVEGILGVPDSPDLSPFLSR